MVMAGTPRRVSQSATAGAASRYAAGSTASDEDDSGVRCAKLPMRAPIARHNLIDCCPVGAGQSGQQPPHVLDAPRIEVEECGHVVFEGRVVHVGVTIEPPGRWRPHSGGSTA